MSDIADKPLPITRRQIQNFEKVFDLPGVCDRAIEKGILVIQEQP
jgi:hypothetical protein